MSGFRYAQFCPVARAAELLCSRWTPLLIRELTVGPRRFSDIRRNLPGISSSVLSERLGLLEERGIVRRRELPPPAGSSVYELTEDGEGLRPVLAELVRWGVRYLLPPRPGEHFAPEWVPAGLAALARRSPAPGLDVEVRIRAEPEPIVVRLRGGSGGTAVGDAAGSPDLTLEAEPMELLAFAAGAASPAAAVAAGRARAQGDLAALEHFRDLFDEVDLESKTPNPNPKGS